MVLTPDPFGNVGDEIRHRAMPTFTDILHTLAPPIASHERLLIHITHDLAGYPSLDPLVYSVFSRVMQQVDGGDLLVIQRGAEFQPAHGTSAGRTLSTAGWRDGPWWRQTDDSDPRDLGLVRGRVEGSKLCRANADAYAAEYFASTTGGLDAARLRAHNPLSESNPVRSSDLFLAVQAILLPKSDDAALFAAPPKEGAAEAAADTGDNDDVCFAVFVLDPVHDISFGSLSQSLPARWARWLDSAPTAAASTASSDSATVGAPTPGSSTMGDEGALGSPVSPTRSDAAARHQHQHQRVPDEIRDIVEAGGVDPREWVAEWLEESLELAVGVVAQRYVARRMGVGEGGGGAAAGEEHHGLGKGKQRMDVLVEENAGEAARAGII